MKLGFLVALVVSEILGLIVIGCIVHFVPKAVAAAVTALQQMRPAGDSPYGRFIYADLKAMALEMCDGNDCSEVPILSIRNIGSIYDTPTGSFDIKTKEPNHFSSIGHVWMPWSMQFSGNFFIHGWSYYPDGTPVPKGYSGGCIRLSDENAKIVYDFAELGTPLIVAK